jgi:hypothetical protein
VEDVLRLAADAFVIRDGGVSYDAKKYRFPPAGMTAQAN